MFNSEQKDRQVEFFSNPSQEFKKPMKDRLRLGKIALSLSYETTFIITISLIMLLIVCYSLGVEKGKQMAQIVSEPIETIKIEAERAEKKAKELPSKPQQEKLRIKAAEAPQPVKPSPYIQVASFRTERHATEELNSLKVKGYPAFTATWGDYKVVCVGKYKDRNEAVKDLKELKKVYADCILHNE